MRYWRKPLDVERIKVPRGKVYLIEERCKGCNFCIEFCPVGVLAASDRFNAKGYYLPNLQNEEACTNCGLCEVICPEFAIYALARDGKEEEPHE